MCIVYQDSDIRKLFPKRDSDSHKGTFGTLLILGGSKRYAGAALLAEAGAAALRTGSGIVRLAVPESLVTPLHERVTECTLFALLESNGYIKHDAFMLQQAITGVTAVVCGVGLGYAEPLFPLIEWLIENVEVPLVLDADALNILSVNPTWLHNRRGATIVTPHIKEMARLTALDSEYIAANKAEAAKRFAAQYGVNVLLKDSVSIITDGDTLILNRRGTPAMAKGGSGDLLSGIIGGLLARRVVPLQAAAAGAYIAGAAAELALANSNEYSLLPSETAQCVAQWLTALLKGNI